MGRPLKLRLTLALMLMLIVMLMLMLLLMEASEQREPQFPAGPVSDESHSEGLRPDWRRVQSLNGVQWEGCCCLTQQQHFSSKRLER